MPQLRAETVSQECLETLITEAVIEGAQPYQAILDRLLKLKPGSEKYHDLLSDLWTAALVMETKAKAAKEVIDEYLDSLPDDN